MSCSSFAKTSATFHQNHRAGSSSSSSSRGKLSARTRLHPNHLRGNRKQRANNFAANKNATRINHARGTWKLEKPKVCPLVRLRRRPGGNRRVAPIGVQQIVRTFWITNRNRNANGMGPVVLRRLGEYRRRRETENAMAFQGEQMAHGHEER